MSSVEIELLPEYSMGRYFQLATLALGGRIPEGNSIHFSSPKDYVRFVENVYDRISRLRTGGFRPPSVLCNDLKVAPKFNYNWQVDKGVAQALGITTGTRNTCFLAASYVEKVLSGRRPLGGKVSIPMLFRATVFSYARGPERLEMRDVECSLDSVGLALLGSLATFIGRAVAKYGKERQQQQQQIYEYYLLPDGSATSMSYAAAVLEVMGGVAVAPGAPSVPEASLNLAKVGVGLDSATYMAAILRALWSQAIANKALGLAGSRAFEAFQIARLEVSGNRPFIPWVGSLGISEAILEASKLRVNRLMKATLNLVRNLTKLGDLSEVARAVSATCVNSLALSLLTGRGALAAREPILDCARAVATFFDRAQREKNPEAMRLASRMLRAIP
ncbi:MAG: hypothetical protein ABWK01_06335 [Infirmifilum sp.]